MNKTKEEIEQTAEQVVDAMLKVRRALGPGLLESTYVPEALGPSPRLPGELERPSDQGRYGTDGQRVMSEFVSFLGPRRAFAVNLYRHTDRFGRLRCESVGGITSESRVAAEARGREPGNPPAPRRERLLFHDRR